MKLINYVADLKITSVMYLLISAIAIGVSLYNIYIGLGILIGIACIFALCLSYVHLDRLNTAKLVELELQKAANKKSIIEKALPPNLIAFPKGTTRIVSCKSNEDLQNGKVIINLRLVMSISEIDRIEEYQNYIKDGLTDVLTSSPIYFQLTDNQRNKYNIYNFQN